MEARLVATQGDPLGTIRQLMRELWLHQRLDGMLLVQRSNQQQEADLPIFQQPNCLDDFNPFKPLMKVNAAALVYKAQQNWPELSFAAMLRPCEMRALSEMLKRDHFDLERVLTISVDCLGTYPVDEYEWRASRKGSTELLTGETLQFARQGGILAYRYRSACQLCASPDAQGADLNIGVIGLPVRKYLLVSVSEKLAEHGFIPGEKMPDSTLETLILQRQRTLAKLSERHNRTRERIEAGIGDLLPHNLEDLLAQFETCGGCKKCLDACPICYVDYPQRDADLRYKREDVARWLVSCAGCGMCEQACPQKQPLSAIFGHIKTRLLEELRH